MQSESVTVPITQVRRQGQRGQELGLQPTAGQSAGYELAVPHPAAVHPLKP